ncbi:MAG: hypothetical protein ACRDF4_07320, partial [Rhabdochlamydiaceae bacterium]
YNRTAGSIRFTTTPLGMGTGGLSPVNADLERMTISPDGKVGINQPTPTEKLDINGDILMEGDNGGWRPGRSIYAGSATSKLSFYTNTSYANSLDFIEMYGAVMIPQEAASLCSVEITSE